MGYSMTVLLPRDLRYAPTARLIAAQSAQACGCGAGPAEDFAVRVEDEIRIQLARTSAAPHVTMGVKRTDEALVVTIDSHIMRLAL
jgi:hypothetical protein